jgi:peptidoglycan/xylan/chitin deacetylase (PgdA/CDA1 family)
VSPTAPGTIVFRGPPDRPRIALTFDDGPSDCTTKVLELLDRHGVKATFFMVGTEVERHPAIGERVRDAGHELGVHSMSHLDHAEGSEAALADVRDGAATIERAIGVELKLFRAPYGHFVPVTLSESERRGWIPVHWSAWGEDWREGETPEAIAARVIVELNAGAIVLLHDGRREKRVDCERMLGALELVLAEAHARGLEPVTVSELLGGP